jgi:hypothetical protein
VHGVACVRRIWQSTARCKEYITPVPANNWQIGKKLVVDNAREITTIKSSSFSTGFFQPEEALSVSANHF